MGNIGLYDISDYIDHLQPDNNLIRKSVKDLEVSEVKSHHSTC